MDVRVTNDKTDQLLVYEDDIIDHVVWEFKRKHDLTKLKCQKLKEVIEM
jgi:hypothetical protein